MSEFFVYDNEKSDCEDYCDDYKNVNITYNNETYTNKFSKIELKIKDNIKQQNTNTTKVLDNEKSNIDIDNKKINNVNSVENL
jgi:hypothetical protein